MIGGGGLLPERALRRAGGGSGPRPWVVVKTWDQGATPTDPSSFRVSGSMDANGVFSGVVNGTTQADGYTENVLYFSVDIADIPEIAGIDWRTQYLAVKLDKLVMAPGTVEAGVFTAVLDQNPGASALGVASAIRQGSASADNSALMGTTGLTFASAGDVLDGLVTLYQFCNDGAAWTTRAIFRGLREDGNQDPGAAGGSGQAITVGPAAAKLVCGFLHGSVDALSNLSVSWQVSVCLVDIADPLG